MRRQSILRIFDAKVAAKFGIMIASMPSRNQLPRPVGTVYILLSFYRRLSMAIVIIFFFDNPTLQITITMYLNISYTCFVAGARLIEDSHEQRSEIFNQSVIVVIMYFMMGFMGQVVEEVEYREKIGYALLTVTGIYFTINLVPLLINMVFSCKKFVKRQIKLREIKKYRARI